jgi:hypothetical protein
MAAQVKKAQSTTPNIFVLVNGDWVPIADTQWARAYREPGFKAILPRLRSGKPAEWHKRWFKVLGNFPRPGVLQ